MTPGELGGAWWLMEIKNYLKPDFAESGYFENVYNAAESRFKPFHWRVQSILRVVSKLG